MAHAEATHEDEPAFCCCGAEIYTGEGYRGFCSRGCAEDFAAEQLEDFVKYVLPRLIEMQKPVLTHATEPRAFRMCRCKQCGTVALCTPTNDFYTRPTDPTKALYCERCMTGRPRIPEPPT